MSNRVEKAHVETVISDRHETDTEKKRSSVWCRCKLPERIPMHKSLCITWTKNVMLCVHEESEAQERAIVQ